MSPRVVWEHGIAALIWLSYDLRAGLVDCLMKRFANLKRLGFFTRLLDQAPPAERYRLAAEQIRHAEAAGSRSTISMRRRVDFRRLSLFSASSLRKRPAFASGPASLRCRWKARKGGGGRRGSRPVVEWPF
jgi:hypothetical protein